MSFKARDNLTFFSQLARPRLVEKGEELLHSMSVPRMVNFWHCIESELEAGVDTTEYDRDHGGGDNGNTDGVCHCV